MDSKSAFAVLLYTSWGLEHREQICFENAVSEAVRWIEYAISTPLPVSSLPAQITDQLRSVITKHADLSEANGVMCNYLLDRFGRYAPKIIFACSTSDPIAEKLRRSTFDASRGAAFVGGPLGAVYSFANAWTVLHEILHLFGANDCYTSSDRGPTCLVQDCVMQYDSGACGTHPQLCRENSTRVHACIQALTLASRSHMAVKRKETHDSTSE